MDAKTALQAFELIIEARFVYVLSCLLKDAVLECTLFIFYFLVGVLLGQYIYESALWFAWKVSILAQILEQTDTRLATTFRWSLRLQRLSNCLSQVHQERIILSCQACDVSYHFLD